MMGELYKVKALWQEGAACDRCARATNARTRTSKNKRRLALGQQLYTALQLHWPTLFNVQAWSIYLSPSSHANGQTKLCDITAAVCRSWRGLAEFNGEAHAHMHVPVRVHARLHTQCTPQPTIAAI